MIDDILAWNRKEAVSSDNILERLQKRIGRDLTAQRHPIKALIIERLKRLPVPQTVTYSGERGAEPTLGTAAVAVFNISELLESILSLLPVRDLLVSGLVNKAFYTLISTSPTLQRKLFLLPAKIRPPRWKLVSNKIDGLMSHSVVSTPSDNSSISQGPKPADGESAPVARLNPLLKLPEKGNDRLSTADRIEWRFFEDSTIFGTRVCESATLDTRILELRAWPHMYLTDPPCTCAHIDVEYAVQASADGPVLRVRRRVYDPAGVTFGAIYHALHEKGHVTIYHVREYDTYSCLPDTTIREQLRILEQQGLRLSLTPEKAVVEFCHLFIPSDAEFEKMERNGRVESSAPPPLW